MSVHSSEHPLLSNAPYFFKIYIPPANLSEASLQSYSITLQLFLDERRLEQFIRAFKMRRELEYVQLMSAPSWNPCNLATK